MKKTVFFTAILMAFALISCNNTRRIDATKWLNSFSDAKTAAQQADKKIILFVSADDSDNLSAVLKENILFKDEFVAAETQKYVLVNLDFSESVYEAAQVPEDASSAEKKAAAAAKKQLEENMDVATYYSVQMSPTIYLLSKEGYVIVQLVLDDAVTSIEAFDAEVDSHAEKIKAFDEALEKTKKGTNLEKVSAIDDFYALTERRHAYHLAPLAREVLKLDPKNESGLAGKYVIELAQVEATDYALKNDMSGMATAFEKAAKNDLLTAEQKQEMYYYAGYYLGGSGSTDYTRVRDYIQKAYDACPDSDVAPEIQNLIHIVDERIAETSQMNEEVKIEGLSDEPVADDSAESAAGQETASENTKEEEH